MAAAPPAWNVADFGERLDKALKRRNRSQKALAAHLDVSEAAVSKWINGAATPTVERFVRICRYLGCTPASLLGISADDPPPPPAQDALPDVARQIEKMKDAEQRRHDEADAELEDLRARLLRRD